MTTHALGFLRNLGRNHGFPCKRNDMNEYYSNVAPFERQILCWHVGRLFLSVYKVIIGLAYFKPSTHMVFQYYVTRVGTRSAWNYEWLT